MTMKTSVVIYSFYKKEFQERVEIEIKKKKIKKKYCGFVNIKSMENKYFYNASLFHS